VNEQTRSATVLLAVPGGQALPMPGDIARAGIIPKKGTSAGVIVPEEAVQVVDGHDAVFVRTAEGFRVATVKVGPRSGGQALILAGLEAGAPVATRNAFLLKAEISKGAGEGEE
jgi:cobalt-zinc-cadmium efflux system membrane fusion protein